LHLPALVFAFLIFEWSLLLRKQVLSTDNPCILITLAADLQRSMIRLLAQKQPIK